MSLSDTQTHPTTKKAVHNPGKSALCLLAFLWMASVADASPITTLTTGCVERPLVPTTFSWSHTSHFQAVVFHDPIASCDETIFQRTDSLLHFEVDYDEARGLRVKTDSRDFPACGRLQFDMHTYLANGTLDPSGLVSLVVNMNSDCSLDLNTPTGPGPDHPTVTNPVPEPASVAFA